jgi:hypothetical protein
MSIAKIITKRNVHSSEFRADEGALMPRRCCGWSAGLVALVLGGLGGGAAAQEPSGRAVGVIPDASALRSEGARPLALQQPVYMGDRIQTGPSGEAQINFVDSTRLVVGPASLLLIDSSVLRNRRTWRSFVVSALRGSFRFISGASPKPAYAIRTPTGTIGVRGTQFDFTVLPNGGTEFVLLEGQARVCDRAGNCLTAQRPCSFISIPPSGPLRLTSDLAERNARLRASFPYIRNQYASLRPEFRANVGSCGNIAAVPVPETPDLIPGALPPAPPAARRAPSPPPSAVNSETLPPTSPPRASPPQVNPPTPSSPLGGPGNGNGNFANRNGGGNIHGSGPGTGNNGINNGQGVGGGGFGSGGGTGNGDNAGRSSSPSEASARSEGGAGNGGGSGAGGGHGGGNGGAASGGHGNGPGGGHGNGNGGGHGNGNGNGGGHGNGPK